MEEVFVPQLAASYRWLSLAAIVAVVAAVWTLTAFRGPTTRNSKLGQTLGPLFLLFAISSVVMVALDLTRSPIIVVAPTYAIIANDTVVASALKRVYLEPVAVSGLAGSTRNEELAIIEYANGSQLILAADEYDTRAVVEAMRVLIE